MQIIIQSLLFTGWKNNERITKDRVISEPNNDVNEAHSLAKETTTEQKSLRYHLNETKGNSIESIQWRRIHNDRGVCVWVGKRDGNVDDVSSTLDVHDVNKEA